LQSLALPDIADLGVGIRADYSQPSTSTAALAGVNKLLLIASNELGQRAVQHQAVIDAARAAGVWEQRYSASINSVSKYRSGPFVNFPARFAELCPMVAQVHYFKQDTGRPLPV
jgi:hypothetical protein